MKYFDYDSYLRLCLCGTNRIGYKYFMGIDVHLLSVNHNYTRVHEGLIQCFSTFIVPKTLSTFDIRYTTLTHCAIWIPDHALVTNVFLKLQCVRRLHHRPIEACLAGFAA